MPIVRVALDVPLPTLFDYEWPATGRKIITGQRVLVPFGRKQLVGLVMEITDHSELAAGRIKLATIMPDEIPPLSGDMLNLLRFCSDYYHYPLGVVAMAALPARLRSVQPVTFREAQRYRLSESGCSLDLAHPPRKSGSARSETGGADGRLLPQSAGSASNVSQPPSKRKVVQRRLLAALQNGALTAAQLRELSPTAPAALKALMQAGWVEVAAETKPAVPVLEGAHVLNAEQQQAVDAVKHTDGYGCFLLHGITGSGKTEVYVHLMFHALQQGGQILMLVPEINLTPQLEQYFRSRFPNTELVSLHSGLADGERAQNWLRAQSGHARIVLGTRLAVFTPMPQLALVIVDEEHDASFKQQDGLRYSARDVAIFRASKNSISIVLGSATPSLESYHNASTGRYRMLELSERAAAEAQLPAVSCIDISRALPEHGLSVSLLTALEQRLQRGEQSLLFVNRRGYAPVLMCTACGWLSGCPHCAGKLVLHLQDRRLRCHHCGHQERVPIACPDCGNTDLRPVGLGTQRVEDALQEHFPQARILRVDRDSTRNKGAWQAMRRQIEQQEVDILVGTQILAKGHDFANLTLVGVINPDSALYSADFRGPERLYAQLAQVAGRAGRGGKPGEVLIQTAFPGHPLFAALINHDFDAWAQSQLEEREMAGFPPFVHQAMLRAESKQEAEVYAFLDKARGVALELKLQVDIYAVVPAAMPRRASQHRAQILVQCVSRKLLQHFLHEWKQLLDAVPTQKVRWSLDVDPLEF